jgi:short-subunit dehydrogenase
VASEIESKYKVKTKIITLDFTKAEEVFDTMSAGIQVRYCTVQCTIDQCCQLLIKISSKLKKTKIRHQMKSVRYLSSNSHIFKQILPVPALFLPFYKGKGK